ncbi:MAG: hypothetical protein AB8G16_15535 [Gammaproteobacteria bacterium]
MTTFVDNSGELRRRLTTLMVLCALAFAQFAHATDIHLGSESDDDCTICCILNLDEGTAPTPVATPALFFVDTVVEQIRASRTVPHQQRFRARAPPTHLTQCF